MLIRLLFGYLLFVNIVAFVLYGIDKKRAIEGHYRISERRLLLAALAGGGAGAFLGMVVFRHKIRKRKFMLAVPLLLLLWGLILTFLYSRMAA